MSIVRAAVIATGRASTLRTSISMNHLLRHQQQHAGALCSAMSTLGKGPASSQAAPAVSPEASSTAARLDGGGGGAGMASRSIGTKKKIGEKVAGEEIRPGARSQVWHHIQQPGTIRGGESIVQNPFSTSRITYY